MVETTSVGDECEDQKYLRDAAASVLPSNVMDSSVNDDDDDGDVLHSLFSSHSNVVS